MQVRGSAQRQQQQGRGLWRRGLAGLGFAAAVAACTAIGGVDNLERVSGDGGSSAIDGSFTIVGDDGSTALPGDDGSTLSHFTDGGIAVLADGDVAASNCTPDPAFCGNRCGDAVDPACGELRHCSTDCGQNNTCNPTTHQCECVPLTGLCAAKCDSIQDNCGNTLNCGGCDAGAGGTVQTCTSNSCGCVPMPDSTFCGGKSCGTAVNNCGQTVLCGVKGNCATAGALCQADGTCCTPDSTACGTSCDGRTVTNHCGGTVVCGTTCAAGAVCTSGACCTPNSAAAACNGLQCGTTTNSCGQVVNCPNTCAAPYTCGGGGANANTCGCTRTTVCNGAQCGTITDNCGNPLTCDTCLDICGTSGICNATTHTCRCNTCTQVSRAGALGPDMQICPAP